MDPLSMRRAFPSPAEERSMDLRHQARQRFINDVAFGGAGDNETLLLLCECGRSDCHDFVTVPRAAFTEAKPGLCGFFTGSRPGSSQ